MSQLKGQLVKITYEGLPLEYEDYMRDPDWMVDELTAITIKALEEAGCKVFTFSGSGEFPALRNVLCDWCRDMMTGTYHAVHYKEGIFCSESCLFEALTQSGKGDGEIRVKNDGPDTEEMLECPHCHELAPIDKWSLEGEYTIPGPEGFTFKAGTCPSCGKNAPLVTAVMVDANDPRLNEDSSNAKERQRMEAESPQGKYNPPPQEEQHTLLVLSVLSKFKNEGWSCTWKERPGHFEVHQVKGDYFFAGTVCDVEDGKQVNLIRIHLRDDEGSVYQSWVIPFAVITPDAILKAFSACINIFETEEIEGVNH